MDAFTIMFSRKLNVGVQVKRSGQHQRILRQASAETGLGPKIENRSGYKAALLRRHPTAVQQLEGGCRRFALQKNYVSSEKD